MSKAAKILGEVVDVIKAVPEVSTVAEADLTEPVSRVDTPVVIVGVDGITPADSQRNRILSLSIDVEVGPDYAPAKAEGVQTALLSVAQAVLVALWAARDDETKSIARLEIGPVDRASPDDGEARNALVASVEYTFTETAFV